MPLQPHSARSLLPLLPLFLLACGDKGQAPGGDSTAPVDADGDGYAEGEDCDDGDSLVHPGARETCNEVDDDCDGRIDDGVMDTWYADEDGDGYGAAGEPRQACDQPEGTTTDDSDCDDTRADIHPGATETCDGVDNDCDGLGDPTQTWWADADGDGFGDPGAPSESCEATTGTVGDYTDCDDTDPEVYPGAPEVCGEGDKDCNGYGPRCSDYSGTYKLADAGLILASDSKHDQAAFGLAAGDLNGDGAEDIAIGAPDADGTMTGFYVIPGGTGISGTWTMGDAGAWFYGTYNAYGGGGVLETGDLDGDGVADLLVNGGEKGDKSLPTAWAFFGPITAGASYEEADLSLYGLEGSEAGNGLTLGDLNGDEVADAVVGATWGYGAGPHPGVTYIVYGPVTAGADRELADSADAKISGTQPGGWFGWVVAAGGDASGDGIGDLLVSAPFQDAAESEAGCVYLFDGPVSGSITADSAAGRWCGVDENDGVGSSSLAFGDIDGDGLADLLVSADFHASNGWSSGAVYVVFGPATGHSFLNAADITLEGENEGDSFGTSVRAGNTDLSGADELLVGAALYADSGAAFLYNGLTSGTWKASDATAIFVGAGKWDHAGWAVAFGDFDGDLYDEVIVGAPWEGSAGDLSGTAYVVWP